MKIKVLLTEKVTYSKELNTEQIAQFKTIQKAHPDWDEDECAKELWNSGKLPKFNKACWGVCIIAIVGLILI